MKILVLIATASALLCSVQAAAHSADENSHKHYFMPENDLHLEDELNVMNRAGLSQNQFNGVINRVYSAFASVVAVHGGVFTPVADWHNSKVNAFASRNENQWVVQMFGGMARRPEMTVDAFMLVMCHELGHHLGGYPFSEQWASNEGQSDFYGAQACMRYMLSQQNNSGFKDAAGQYAAKKCDAAWAGQPSRNICYRTSAAGKAMARVLAYVNKEKEPKFETPSKAVVSQTYMGHPKSQCRLDTYLSGALCTTQFNLGYIPGNLPYALQTSCSTGVGARPKCWFRAN